MLSRTHPRAKNSLPAVVNSRPRSRPVAGLRSSSTVPAAKPLSPDVLLRSTLPLLLVSSRGSFSLFCPVFFLPYLKFQFMFICQLFCLLDYCNFRLSWLSSNGYFSKILPGIRFEGTSCFFPCYFTCYCGHIM